MDSGNADFIFCNNPTFPALLLSAHLSLIHTVLTSLCALSHFPHYPFLHIFPPAPFLSRLSSCLWKTPRQSCLGSRGTQTPMESGLWLSLLCQVCQVCVCGVTGKLTPCWLCLSGHWSQHGTLKWVPFYHFFFSLWKHLSMAPRESLTELIQHKKHNTLTHTCRWVGSIVIFMLSGCEVVVSWIKLVWMCSVVKCFLLVQWFWFDPAVACSAVYWSAVKCITLKWSAVQLLCGVVLICFTIFPP